MRHSLILSLVISLAQSALSSDHPGNVFLAGENVRVAIPKTWVGWRAIDIDRKDVGHGDAHKDMADLGKLPIGYFEVHEKDGTGLVTAAVLAKVAPVENTPIAIDAAMSWFYSDPEKIRGACKLCRLAGVNWVRDRVSWPEIENARGMWSGDTRYERAMRIEHEEGLKVLQVNHIPPPWAPSDPLRFPDDLRDVHDVVKWTFWIRTKHFPDDLRDVYSFYQGLAKRWHGLADAIEPWNEPDIDPFGSQTGCEIASFQKAAYLGLKAGDPDWPVNLSVFAIDRAETLDEFGANEVYPYFDRYDLHHYIKLADFPRAYGRHRAISGGRPMWTTEFNLNIFWSDEKTKELSDEDLRIQAYRISKAFAEALHEGTQKAFYFIFGHYVEQKIVYGIVHADLTPRPGYVAFAAVGRLLNGAQPIGRVDLGDEKLMGYVFKTQVDGAERETLVTWSETKPTTVKFRPFEKAYDYLGREISNSSKVELSRPPLFLVGPRGWSKGMKVQPPPAKAKWRAGNACPVVLQLIGHGDEKQSSFLLDKANELRLVAYNFGNIPAHGKLGLQGASCEKSELKLDPGQRQELSIKVHGSKNVTVRLGLGDVGHAIVSARVRASN